MKDFFVNTMICFKLSHGGKRVSAIAPTNSVLAP